MKPSGRLASAVAFAALCSLTAPVSSMRRGITGRLVITSGGQTLFTLKFTATPAVTA